MSTGRNGWRQPSADDGPGTETWLVSILVGEESAESGTAGSKRADATEERPSRTRAAFKQSLLLSGTPGCYCGGGIHRAYALGTPFRDRHALQRAQTTVGVSVRTPCSVELPYGNST